MFTGLVQGSYPVVSVADRPSLRCLTIALTADDLKLGESIAINGVCLTVAAIEPDSVRFDVIGETLSKTNLGGLVVGDAVHVERSMRVGDRFDGHFVQGHVDATAALLARRANADDWRLVIELPDGLRRFVAAKGSITVDGVSLTVAAIGERDFEVALIPTTLNVTHLGRRERGYRFNIETDMIAKTVVRYLDCQPPTRA